jgi:hypothetical protein
VVAVSVTVTSAPDLIAAILGFPALWYLAGVLAHPRGRDKLVQHAQVVRRLYVEAPLRLVTGRRRPDYERIAELERTELQR